MLQGEHDHHVTQVRRTGSKDGVIVEKNLQTILKRTWLTSQTHHPTIADHIID
jgi:hypothetical protein